MGDQVSRRSSIKKAAVGTAAVGTAWAAPRVAGLSLRPEYASAQTGGGDVSVNFTQDVLLMAGPFGSPRSFFVPFSSSPSIVAVGDTFTIPSGPSSIVIFGGGAVVMPPSCLLTGGSYDTVSSNFLRLFPPGSPAPLGILSSGPWSFSPPIVGTPLPSFLPPQFVGTIHFTVTCT